MIPLVAPHARTVALDLIGFGRSDQPLTIDYDLPTYTASLEGGRGKHFLPEDRPENIGRAIVEFHRSVAGR